MGDAWCIAAPARDQRAQLAVALVVAGQQHQARTIGQPEQAAGQQLDVLARLGATLGLLVGAHDAGQRALVGEGDGPVAEAGGARHQFLRMRGPAQEGEVAGAGQLGVVDVAHGSGHGR